MKSVIAFVFVLGSALLQIGCSGGQIGRIAGGAIGGGGGAAIGKAADKNGYLGPVLGGAIGGAVGAETGNAIGDAFDAQSAQNANHHHGGNQVRYTSVGDSPALEAARTGETVSVEEGAWKHEYVPQAPDSHGTVRVKMISSINGEIKRTKILRIRP